MIQNREFLNKLDLAVADLTSGAGQLQTAQAKAFMRIMIDQSVMLQQATAVPMRSPKQLIEKIRFASRVLRAGQEGTAVSQNDRVKPNLTKVELDAQLFKAEVRIPQEVLEDNIEGEELKQTIMSLLGEAIGRDMEEWALQADTASLDPFLAKGDGLLKLTTSNISDAGTVRLQKSVLKDAIRIMPTPFLRNRKALKFYTSVDAEADYRDSIADRSTILGDKAVEDEYVARYAGIDVLAVPLMPGDVGAGLTGTTSTLLTDPKNFQLGIWRQITVETDKIIQEGVHIIVASLRFDVAWAEETAVVKITNVKV